MPFLPTCKNVRIEGADLVADCLNLGGSYTPSRLSLDLHIGNDDGVLRWEWQRFSASAKHIRINDGILSATTARCSGALVKSTLDLNEKIWNNEGALEITGTINFITDPRGRMEQLSRWLAAQQRRVGYLEARIAPWIKASESIDDQYRPRVEDQFIRAFTELETLIGHAFAELEDDVLHRDDATTTSLRSSVCSTRSAFQVMLKTSQDWLASWCTASEDVFVNEAHIHKLLKELKQNAEIICSERDGIGRCLQGYDGELMGTKAAYDEASRRLQTQEDECASLIFKLFGPNSESVLSPLRRDKQFQSEHLDSLQRKVAELSCLLNEERSAIDVLADDANRLDVTMKRTEGAERKIIGSKIATTNICSKLWDMENSLHGRAVEVDIKFCIHHILELLDVNVDLIKDEPRAKEIRRRINLYIEEHKEVMKLLAPAPTGHEVDDI